MADYSKDLVRKEKFCWFVERLGRYVLQTYFDVQYEGLKNFEGLRNKGFVLLPKHQRRRDIVYEGIMFKRFLNVFAYFMMKNTFRWPFDVLQKWLGGIETYQWKYFRNTVNARLKAGFGEGKLEGILKEKRDVRREEIKEEVRSEMEERIDFVYEMFAYLLNKGEVVVIQPEATRKFRKKLSVNKDVMKRLVTLPELVKDSVTYVPLDIYYERLWVPRSDVILKVGEPFELDYFPEFMAEVEIKKDDKEEDVLEKKTKLREFRKEQISVLEEHLEKEIVMNK